MANTMKALRFHGNQNLQLDEIQIPEVKDNQVKVKPAWTGICGTDLHEYLIGPAICPQKPHPVTGEQMPLTLGHEFSGVVDEVGKDVTKYKKGDKVVIEPIIYDGTCGACTAGHFNCCYQNGYVGFSGFGGGLAEYVVLDEVFINSLPDGVSLTTGALVEPLAVAMRAVDNGDIKASDNVLILGGGPIGLAVLLCLQSRGVSSILVSEMAATRKAMASEFGATHVFDPSKDDVVARCQELFPDAGGVDVAFDCAGVPAALLTALQCIRSKGTVVNVAVWEKKVDFDPNSLVFKEKRMVGTSAPEHKDIQAVLDALRDGTLMSEKLDKLVSKKVDLHEAEQEGYKALINDKDSHIKILVKVHGG